MENHSDIRENNSLFLTISVLSGDLSKLGYCKDYCYAYWVIINSFKWKMLIPYKSLIKQDMNHDFDLLKVNSVETLEQCAKYIQG